jgi:hypothetical protein
VVAAAIREVLDWAQGAVADGALGLFVTIRYRDEQTPEAISRRLLINHE